MRFRSQFLLLSILLLGTFLRFHGLGRESLWLDEGASLRVSQMEIPQMMQHLVHQEVHVPLYFILLHFWVGWFGDSECSCRLLSAFFGFLGLVMICKAGALLFDREVGILSCFLLSVSTYHISFSQEVRMYVLVGLLTITSYYFFIKLLKQKGKVTSIGYVFSCVLLLYTHLYGCWIILSQNIYLATVHRAAGGHPAMDAKTWIALQAGVLLLFLPWIGPFVGQVSRAEAGQHIGWLSVPSGHSLVNSFKAFSGSDVLLCFFLTLVLLALLNRQGNRLAIRFSDDDAVYLLFVWLFVTVAFPFIVSKISAPIYHTRYLVGSLFPFYVLAAKGMSNIRLKHVKLAVTCAVLVFSLRNVWSYSSTIHREQWRDVAAHIESHAQPQDMILFHPGWLDETIFEYYARRRDLIKKPFPASRDNVDENSIQELRGTVETHRRVWVVLSHSRDPGGLIPKTLHDSYDQQEEKSYVGIELYLFSKKETPLRPPPLPSPS